MQYALVTISNTPTSPPKPSIPLLQQTAQPKHTREAIVGKLLAGVRSTTSSKLSNIYTDREPRKFDELLRT